MSWNFSPWDPDWRLIVRSLERWQDNQIICVKLWLNPCIVYSSRPEAWDFSNTVRNISVRFKFRLQHFSPHTHMNWICSALFSQVLLTHLSCPQSFPKQVEKRFDICFWILCSPGLLWLYGLFVFFPYYCSSSWHCLRSNFVEFKIKKCSDKDYLSNATASTIIASWRFFQFYKKKKISQLAQNIFSF